MAVTLGGIGGRAALGATAGSLAGPIGTGIGAAAGGVWGLLEGLLSGDGGQGATDAAGAEKIRKMQEAYGIIQQQRGQRNQVMMNQLANKMGAYQGAANVMASMYGPQGSMAPNINLSSGGPRMGTTGPGTSGNAPPPQAPMGRPAGSLGGAPPPPRFMPNGVPPQAPIGTPAGQPGGAAPPPRFSPNGVPPPTPMSVPAGAPGGAPPPPSFANPSLMALVQQLSAARPQAPPPVAPPFLSPVTRAPAGPMSPTSFASLGAPRMM